jgi:hypothetical protein
MRHRTKHKIFHAGVFKPASATYDLVTDFLNTLEPPQVIAVTPTADGKIIVWYRER